MATLQIMLSLSNTLYSRTFSLHCSSKLVWNKFSRVFLFGNGLNIRGKSNIFQHTKLEISFLEFKKLFIYYLWIVYTVNSTIIKNSVKYVSEFIFYKLNQHLQRFENEYRHAHWRDIKTLMCILLHGSLFDNILKNFLTCHKYE